MDYTMAKKITLSERETIFELLAKNEPIASIAFSLNRHRSTICREISRIPGVYLPSAAQNNATLKQKNSKRQHKLQNEDLKKNVNDKVLLFWSLEQVMPILEFPISSHYFCYFMFHIFFRRIALSILTHME